MRLRNVCTAGLVASLSVPLLTLAQGQALGDSGNALAASQVQDNAPGSASAGSSTDSATFNRLDQDKDGFITREEAAGSELANRFDELDKNHDGKLSQSELGASAATGGSSTSEYSSGPGNRYDSND